MMFVAKVLGFGALVSFFGIGILTIITLMVLGVLAFWMILFGNCPGYLGATC
jgi:hypothetical protein